MSKSSRLKFSLASRVCQTSGAPIPYVHFVPFSACATEGPLQDTEEKRPRRPKRPPPPPHGEDFWALERIGIETETAMEKKYTTDELLALQLIEKVTTYDADKKVFTTGLLFDPTLNHRAVLDDNFKRARAVLVGTLRKLDNKGVRGEVEAEYDKLLEAGFIGKVPPLAAQRTENVHTLVTHVVERVDSVSTRQRIVVNASANCRSGYSLNSTLLVGPCLYAALDEVLLLWRKYPVAYTADISKFFHRLKMREEDQDWQRVLYRWAGEEEITVLKFLVLMFGVNHSPFSASHALLSLCGMFADSHPRAAEVGRRSIYVDDVVTGARDKEEAKETIIELIDMLSQASMPLRKFQCNDYSALDFLPDEMKMEKGAHCKILGHLWAPEEDFLYFNFILVSTTRKVKLKGGEPLRRDEYGNLAPNFEDLLQNQSEEATEEFLENLRMYKDDEITKRVVASTLGALFDVYGFLQPYVTAGKVIYQAVWKCGMPAHTWDEPLPPEIVERWKEWMMQLPLLTRVGVRRLCVLPDYKRLRLVICADASAEAMAAVVYAVSENDEEVFSTIIMSKSRVMPTKNVLTIPRAELAACEIAAKIGSHCARVLGVDLRDVYCFSDSATACFWLWKGKDAKRRVWIDRRVEKITTMLPHTQWRHCASTDNFSADLASRGTCDLQLLGQKWQDGPSFVSDPPESWPPPGDVSSLSLEEREKIALEDKVEVLKSMRVNVVYTHPVAKVLTVLELRMFYAFELWNKVILLTAYVFRFINRLREAVQNRKQQQQLPPATANVYTPKWKCTWKGEGKLPLPTVEEQAKARDFWLARAQHVCFTREFNALKHGGKIEKDSILARHRPFYDKKRGLLRATTRLVELGLDESQSKPVILPRHDKIVVKFVLQMHYNLNHAPFDTVLARLRTEATLMGGRSELRRILHLCRETYRGRCRRPKTAEQVMAPLPAERGMNPVFMHVGTDYFGFYTVRRKPGSPETHKVWVVLFCCLSTRAVALELVEDMTVVGFLHTLRRFCSVYSVPTVIWSDNGTSYVAAAKELKKLKQPNSIFWQEVERVTSAEMNIEWKFTPPMSPHCGGVWESLVKAAKKALNVMTRGRVHTQRAFETYLRETQGLMNQRPLAPVSPSADAAVPVTPHALMFGRPHQLLPDTRPEPKSTPTPAGRMWTDRKKILKAVWENWQEAYLLGLALPKKWFAEPDTAVKVGMRVLVNDKPNPRGSWKWGIIEELIFGRDGRPRRAKVRLPPPAKAPKRGRPRKDAGEEEEEEGRKPESTVIERSIHRLSLFEDVARSAEVARLQTLQK